MLFETERCSINTLQKPDFDDVKQLFVNREVRKFLGGIREEDSIQVILESSLNHAFCWVVREKHSGAFIGLVSLDLHHDGIHQEISYQFLPKWWGKGYATEVVRVIVEYALNELNLTKLIAETQIANEASCKLLERVGMLLERTFNRFGAEQAIYSIKKRIE